MAEIALIDVLRGVVNLRDGAGDGASKPRADPQGDQFNDSEDDSSEQQQVFDSGSEISKRCEQR